LITQAADILAADLALTGPIVRTRSMNPALRPMLATLVDKPFDDKNWVFETKWDGFRLVSEKRGRAVRLWSRNGIDVTEKYAVLLPALQKIDGSCVLDGELCALDAHGRSRFQLLQNALNKKATLLYVLFDVLFVGGRDIRKKPLLVTRLPTIVTPTDLNELVLNQGFCRFGEGSMLEADSQASEPHTPTVGYNGHMPASALAEPKLRVVTTTLTQNFERVACDRIRRRGHEAVAQRRPVEQVCLGHRTPMLL
jgi:hypothetical protein